MGRGLFYLIAGAVAAWSLYSYFTDSDREERPPPPRSPSPSRRRDAWQSTSSRVDHLTAGASRSPPNIPSRRRDNDLPVNTFHPRPPTPFDDCDSSRAVYPPAQTYGSLSQPRSPPHIPSHRRSDRQPDGTAVNTYPPPSPSHRRDALQTASSRVTPVGTSTSFGQPPAPLTPSRRRDDRVANDIPVKTYRPQSSSPALIFTHFDSSRVEDPPVKAHVTLDHPRSPSPHIPTGHDDWEDIDPPVGTYHPPCTRRYQIDARGTIASSKAEIPPAKAPASISHPRSPLVASRGRKNRQAKNPPVETPTFIYTVDGWKTLKSSRIEDPPVKAHPSPSHPGRSSSPHVPSRQCNNQPISPPVETYTTPTFIYTVDGWKTLESSRVEDPPVKAHPSLSHPQSASPHTPSHQRDDQQTPDSESEGEYPPSETSASLRKLAKQEGTLRSKCLQESKKAHERGLYALAQAYSIQAKDHARTMESLDARASAMVFKENNKTRPSGEIDLHGLYVGEAISYVNTALKEARQRGASEMCLIVGQGNHSDGGIARLKPAIKQFLRKRKVDVHEDTSNPGRLWLVI